MIALFILDLVHATRLRSLELIAGVAKTVA
jgi:hypothetical protein